MCCVGAAIGPFEGGRQLPDVVRIHPGRVFLHSHQENVLLLVGRVESQDAHHDEVRDEGELGNAHRLSPMF